MATIYDYPLYYDIAFGWDRTPEADFYDGVFDGHGVAKDAPVLEVACGTGRVARLLAKRGWRVSGVDLSAGMTAFLAEEAAAEGTAVDVITGDVRERFAAEGAFAAAYNPMSSFRMLGGDADVAAHLAAMAHVLRPGGAYVLDMDFVADPDDVAVTTDEEWEMDRGDVTVRAANDAVHVTDGGRELVLEWAEEAHLRPYTTAMLEGLVAESGAFAVESWHPEAGRNAEGASTWSVGVTASPPLTGRTMVVLRRV